MKDTNAAGAQTEGRVLAALIKAGYTVAIPFGVARYDLIIETPEGFRRVQCKTGRLREGAIIFNAYSLGSDRRPGKMTKQSYQGAADLFGVFCPELDGTYLVPVENSAVEVRLRVKAAKNGQKINVRWARDYELK